MKVIAGSTAHMVAEDAGSPNRGRRAPIRSELKDATIEAVKTGSVFNADVYVVDIGDGPVMVKDYAPKRWWARLIGRFMIARECEAYRVLGNQPGVVPFVGRIDALALATEKLDTVEINWAKDKATHGQMLFDQLRDTLGRMHALGVAHLDLRSRRNVIVDENHRVYVLDLASAQYLRPGTIPHRLVFHFLKGVDDMALPKYKRLLHLELTDGDRRLKKIYNFWRSLWRFNLVKKTEP